MKNKINWYKTPFKSKGLNEVFYRLFCFLTWNNYLHFRISHFNHHLYTVHRGLDKEVIIMPDPFNAADYLSRLTFDIKKFKMFIVPTGVSAATRSITVRSWLFSTGG